MTRSRPPAARTAQHTDVSDSRQCGALVATAVERYGRLDVLYNNAGIALFGGRLPAGVDPAVWDRVIRTNLERTSTAAIRDPRNGEAGGGSIINTASSMAHLPHGGLDGYAAARVASRCSPSRWPRAAACSTSASTPSARGTSTRR